MTSPNLSVVTCLLAISTRSNAPFAVAKAAVICAEAGSERDALRIAFDLDALLHEAVTLHGALRLIGRLRLEPGEAMPTR